MYGHLYLPLKSKPLIAALAFAAVWLSAALHEHLEGAGFLPEHSHGHSHETSANESAPQPHDGPAPASDSHVPLVTRGHQEIEIVVPGLLLLGAILIATKLLHVLWRALLGVGMLRPWRPPLSAERCGRCFWQFTLRCAPISAAPPASA